MRISLIGVVFMVACGSSSRTPDASVDATADGNPGTACGGLAGIQCRATEYCDFPTNSCGIADESGTCKTRPAVCPAVIGPPTCGCDGMVHPGDCPTYTTGTDLNANGACPLEPGRFKCGYVQCDLATQYCRRDLQQSGAYDYSCVPLPAGCDSPASCTCLRAERCGGMCTGDGKDGMTLTCV
jgi:hypothetical protein